MVLYFVVFSVFLSVIASSLLAGRGELVNSEALNENLTLVFENEVKTNPLYILFAEALSLATVLATFKLTYKRPFTQMGFAKRQWFGKFVYGCVFGVIAISAVCVPMFLTGAVTITSIDFPNGLFLAWIPAYISIGFAEEALFRGYCMTALKTTRSKYAVIIIPSVFFAVLHASNSGFDFASFALLNLFLSGVMFGLMFLKSGSIWIPAGFHAIWNMFTGIVYGMSVSGSFNSASIIKSDMTGSSPLITGGDFGPEASVTVIAVAILSSAFMLFAYKPKTPAEWTVDSDLPFIKG
jgi:membrane protease YdiL (CAAX protease family)